jgi:SAM-dependent methyltransferase
LSTEQDIRKAVRDRYAKLAASRGCCSKSCCASNSDPRIREHSDEDLSSLPGEAGNVSAGCGNPLALMEVQEGQVVLDLGSGGGIDVFLASPKVGPEGRVLGIDSTPEMVWRARETAEKEGYDNVEFRLGEIEHLPVDSESVDLVISNCVINLSPDKDQVFREIYRVLKPGGRMSVSDIVILAPLPREILEDLQSWSECVSGAISEEEYIEKVRAAGMANIEVKSQRTFGDALEASIEDLNSDQREGAASLVEELSKSLASDDIIAEKPRE